MRVQIQKWGNSLALRIPKSFALESSIERGTSVELSLIDGKLIIEPVAETNPDLDRLLSAITDDNLHGEIETGNPVGKEVW